MSYSDYFFTGVKSNNKGEYAAWRDGEYIGAFETLGEALQAIQ